MHTKPNTFRNALVSELLKFFSLRSNMYALTTIFLVPTLSAFARTTLASDPALPSSEVQSVLDATASVTMPMTIFTAILVMATLTGENSTGSIILTRLDNPNRKMALLAKLLVALVLVLICSTSSFVLAMSVASNVVSHTSSISLEQWNQLGHIEIVTICASVVAFSIAIIFKSAVSAMITFGVVIAVFPPMVAFSLGDKYANLTITSAIQSATTIFPGRAFPLAGVATSPLESDIGSLVAVIWGLAFLSVSLVFQNYTSFRFKSVYFSSRKPLVSSGEIASIVGFSKPGFGSSLRATLIRFLSPLSARSMLLLIFGLAIWSNAIGLRGFLEQLRQQEGQSSFTIQLLQSQFLNATAPIEFILFSLFGVLLFINDEATGVIRSVVLATPKRFELWWVQVTALSLLGVAAEFLLKFVAAVMQYLAYSSNGYEVELISPAVLNGIFSAELNVVVALLIGFSTATLCRTISKAITAVLALIAIIPTLLLSVHVIGQTAMTVIVYNIGVLMPTGALASIASNWLGPDSYTPQFMNQGMLQLSASQAQATLIFWGVLFLGLPVVNFVRRRY